MSWNRVRIWRERTKEGSRETRQSPEMKTSCIHFCILRYPLEREAKETLLASVISLKYEFSDPFCGRLAKNTTEDRIIFDSHPEVSPIQSSYRETDGSSRLTSWSLLQHFGGVASPVRAGLVCLGASLRDGWRGLSEEARWQRRTEWNMALSPAASLLTCQKWLWVWAERFTVSIYGKIDSCRW